VVPELNCDPTHVNLHEMARLHESLMKLKKSKSQWKPKGPYPTPRPPYGIWHMVELVENDRGLYLNTPLESTWRVDFKYAIRF
jgi:hypothetical protein